MNNKGFITPIALAFLTVLFLYTAVIFHPLTDTRNFINEHIDYVKTYHKRKAAITRTLNKLRNNISYSITTEYSDLDQTIEIKEISSETDEINIYRTTLEERLTIPFDIYSETEVNINIYTEVVRRVTLYSPTGDVIFSEFVYGSKSWVFSDIYDSETDTWGYGYGTYELEISGGYAGVSIRYLQTVKRIIEIKNKFTHTVTIELNPNGLNIISPST